MLRLTSKLNWFGTTARKSLEDDYEVLSVLGQGSTSRVFLGIDIRDYHKVVLKMFKKMDEAKIQREIGVLRELRDCPNIIPLEAVFRNEGSNNYTFVMPHYPGTTLNHLMKSLDIVQVRNFMQDILTALAYMHNKGIMHRDIKPSNVLVCSKGPEETTARCRVFDFGLAQHYRPNEEYKYSVGTKCYKPPELLLRQKNYTPMLDIWTSGVVLAEMIYQTKPLFPYIANEELMLKQVLKRCRSGYDILTENYREIFGKIKQQPLNITKALCPKGAELSDMMMDANPKNRPTAEQCLRHPFFKT